MRLFHIHVATSGARQAYRTWLIVARSDRDALRYVPQRKSPKTVVAGVDDMGEARDPYRRGVIGWMAGRPTGARKELAAARPA